MHNGVSLLLINTDNPFSNISIVGLVVEFVVAIDEARVRFTDDALSFFYFSSFWRFHVISFQILRFWNRD